MSATTITACAVLVAACGARTLAPSAPEPLPRGEVTLLRGSRDLDRMVPPEAYLRAYLMWFGRITPREIEVRAHAGGLFDSWTDYLAALGLPDYKRDLPRQDQTNALMLSALGRLGEALCVRAAEHDLHQKTPLAARIVFRFDPATAPDLSAFSAELDVLHRKFLGYPLRLAPSARAPRFFQLYRDVAARNAGAVAPLTADETAWVAVCSALIQHPEVQIY